MIADAVRNPIGGEPGAVSWKSGSRPFRHTAPLFLVIIPALACRLLLRPWTYDDGFISFRYALHWAQGLGPVFNVGERVIGYSCPLYVAILAVCARLGFDLQTASLALSVLADLCTVACLYAIGLKLTNSRIGGVLPALLFAVLPKAVIPDAGGMETGLYIALIIGTVAALVYGKPFAAAALAGLAAVTRPEGFLIGLIALGYLAIEQKSLPWKQLALWLAPAALWILGATAYYGYWVPLPVHSKNLFFRPFPDRFYDAKQLLHYIGAPFGAFAIDPNMFAVGLLQVLVLCVIGYGFFQLSKGRTAAIVLVAWFLIYFATFAGINKWIFRWYEAPLLPVVCLAIGLSAFDVIRRFSRRPARVGVATGATVALLVFETSVYPKDLWFHKWEYTIRESQYVEAGRWAASHYGTRGWLAAYEVGSIAYGYDGPVLDLLGLVSPQSVPYLPSHVDDWILASNCPLVIGFHGNMDPKFLDSGRFLAEYYPARSVRTGYTAYDPLVVYRKKPKPRLTFMGDSTTN